MAAPPAKRRGCLFCCWSGRRAAAGLFGCAVIANLCRRRQTCSRNVGSGLPGANLASTRAHGAAHVDKHAGSGNRHASTANSDNCPVYGNTRAAYSYVGAGSSHRHEHIPEVATATPAPPTATTVPPAIIGAVASDNANLNIRDRAQTTLLSAALWLAISPRPVGRNEAGDWLGFPASGAWIAALVLNALQICP